MVSVAEIGAAMKSVLTTVATTAARESGFVQRASKLTGALFVQTTVLGWLNNPNASLGNLTQVAAALGVTISPQGLDQRFSRAAAETLQRVLQAAVAQVISAEPVAIPVLARFSAVILQDSSTISLPTDLATFWPGCGGSGGLVTAALKIHLRLDLLAGRLADLLLETGRTSDRGSPLQKAPLARGALRIADLGYFSLPQLRAIADQSAYFLSRLFGQTSVSDPDGARLDLARILSTASATPTDRLVLLGTTERLPARMIAVPVSQEVADQRRRRLRASARSRGKNERKAALVLADWTILVTNVPGEMLAVDEALVLARVRWQIELLFKLWKQHGKLDEWRSQNPERILGEVYAKLTGLLIQHWLFLIGCWGFPDRSLVKAAQTVRTFTPLLISAFAGFLDAPAAVDQIRRCLAAGCRMNHRKKEPNAYQLMLDLPNAA